MRKLAVTAGFFAAAIFISQYLLPEKVQLWVGLSAFLIFIIFIFIKKLNAVRYITVGLALGLIWNYTYDKIGLSAARLFDGTTQTVTASVIAYPEASEYGKSVLIRIGKTKCRLYIYSEDYTELNAGDEISVKASFTMTGDKTGSDYYYSLGIPLFAYAKSRPDITGKAPFSLQYIPAQAGKLLGESIDKTCASAAPFIKSIITGDRNDFKKDTYIYSLMSVTGIIHCVSVSGMHVSFLAGLIYFLLGRKRLASLICVPAVFFFMAMTGFSAAVVRAGIMQLAVFGAALTRREYDGRTALFLSLALLLAVNPFSAQDAGLQLSFGATLGILLFNEKLNAALSGRMTRLISLKIVGKAVRWFISTLSVSLCALIFTVPLTALIFERVSVISPLTNILTLWAVSFCFIIGLISALAGFIWLPIGVIIAFPAVIMYKYIYWLLEMLGKIPFASVYTDGIYIRFWLVFVYAALVWFIFTKRKGKALPFTFTAVISLAIALTFELTEVNSDDFRFTALEVGQGQCIVVTSKNYTAVIDCGGSSSRNAGDLAAEYLASLGRTKVDSLILTHYHSDHAGGALELMKRLRIDKIYAPETDTEDKSQVMDWELKPQIAESAAKQDTELISLSGEVKCFSEREISFQIIPPLDYSDENEVCNCVLISCGDFDCLITGDVDTETELRLLERIDMPDLELLIAGHHGSGSSTSTALLKEAKPEAVIISVGHNIYGHPSTYLLDRLDEYSPSVNIYRTDEVGDITITYNKVGINERNKP